MPRVTDPSETRALLEALRAAGAAVPCFCTENQWTVEAVLAAAAAAGERHGLAAPPVFLAFTAGYHGRQNLAHYWTCGDQRLAFRAVLNDLDVLLSGDSPYATCRVFLHLDHGQPGEDRWLLRDHVDEFAMVMFDASGLPLDENVALTAGYVREFGDRTVVEGAVDELKEAGDEGDAFDLTTPEQAARFLRDTGCDLIVPNVGTEHRASAAGVARYAAERAREIRDAVGPRLVLHGTSCLADGDLRGLPGDGFVKINVWTAIERAGGAQTAEFALENAGLLLDEGRFMELADRGAIGERSASPEHIASAWGGRVGPRLDAFPLINLRRAWVGRVAGMLGTYFDLLGYGRLAGL
jgi:fructose/tagatose bisphosphate aldolase